ncbi:MAG: hypothetical protein K9N47_05695 [Prosthecobacter sp.]|uniref:hypothetical protein n=1 Tax=Prosthecobacter sp. TaxID=1965333 RepID=UPI0025CE7A7D|nr:hypothetical protein [Prosthecobacter sp.]MCF7785594.1 hypothetical protein [Prosthecobacter sp.]
MNPTLIHLAALECYQRATKQGVSLAPFIVLQTIAAAGDTRIKSKTMAKESGYTWPTLRRHLQSLTSKGYAVGTNIARKTRFGRPRKVYNLTALGLELMTPQPRARAERTAP